MGRPSISTPATSAAAVSENGAEKTELVSTTKWPEPSSRPRPRGFVELLGRSNFSFLQAASHPEEMVEQAIVEGYDGLAICDLNGLYGVVRGWEAVNSPSQFVASIDAKKNFRYLIGSELTLTDGFSVALLPMNKAGYTSLCELLTLGKRQAAKGFSRLSFGDLAVGAQDCLCFLFPPWTDEIYARAAEAFGDRLYLPVWKDLTWESVEFYTQALRLEREKEARLFVTQRPFMHSRSRKPVFDVLSCILHKTTLEEAGVKLIQNGERHLRPMEELSRLWQERPDLVERTLEIAARVTFDLREIRYRYPRGHLPPGRSPADHLRVLTDEGLHRRFPEGTPEKVRAQAERELALIQELQYEDYFLTLHEVCAFAREQGILHQGRGSAANSVVCFAIGLTAVDPRRVDLLFERFISKERGEPPDIDIDFEHERREEVLQHIYSKYGERHAAMVCNVIRYRSRMAFRETAKVFGVPLGTINAAIKFMGRDGLRRLLEDAKARANFGLDDETWKMILDLARQISGFPRHLGIHVGGFILTQDPITESVPVEKATMDGRFVVQWNKDDVNALGLMKIDLLSLGMLTCLRKCFDLVREVKGVDLDLAKLPADDVATYQMIGEADTVGVFQIESRAQMITLPRMKPRNYYDLVVQVALIRPGPLQGGMVHPYLRRRKGVEKVHYPHPDLRPILEKTMGVPLFQEQIMQIAVVGAGFTPGEADELRRLMSAAWRRQGVMKGVRDRVMRGLREKGIPENYALQIYQTIEGFSNYGFPESHAASFALLTYASCYLKHHHPEAFTCALLNSQPMGFYGPRALIADAQRHGVEVRDFNVNKSSWDCALEPHPVRPALRLGFRVIRGFRQEWAETLEEARIAGGNFSDPSDLVRRARLPKAALMKLAAVGAMGEFGHSPRALIWMLEAMELDEASFLFANLRSSFVGSGTSDDRQLLPIESEWAGLNREYAHKGFSLESHPVSILRPVLEDRNRRLRARGEPAYENSARLKTLRHGTRLRVAGLADIIQRPPTAKGFCFITLEDESGFINVIVPPEIYEKDRVTLYSNSLFDVVGRLEKVDGVINVRAFRLYGLLKTEQDRALNAPTAHTGLRGR